MGRGLAQPFGSGLPHPFRVLWGLAHLCGATTEGGLAQLCTAFTITKPAAPAFVVFEGWAFPPPASGDFSQSKLGLLQLVY